jgi:hypothetical protein
MLDLIKGGGIIMRRTYTPFRSTLPVSSPSSVSFYDKLWMWMIPDGTKDLIRRQSLGHACIVHPRTGMHVRDMQESAT